MSTSLPVKYDPTMLEKLTELEKAFVLHPLVMVNAQKAAVESGYSEAWARGNAASKRKQLLYYILPVQRERMKKADITLDRIQEELASIAFADEAEFYDRVDMGAETLLVGKDPTLLPENLRRAIQQIALNTIVLSDGSTIQIPSFVLHDKKVALKLLAEMLGGFDPRSREPGDAAEKRKQALLFDYMQPNEIDTIVKIYQRAEKRQRASAADAEIIVGEKKK